MTARTKLLDTVATGFVVQRTTRPSRYQKLQPSRSDASELLGCNRSWPDLDGRRDKKPVKPQIRTPIRTRIYLDLTSTLCKDGHHNLLKGARGRELSARW